MNSVVHNILYCIDWAAASTILLTVITGYYAWSTKRILDATARQAAAAERNIQIALDERQERLRQHHAPIASSISLGQAVLRQWLSIDFAALRQSNVWPDSQELESLGLAELIEYSRVLFFPMAQALVAIEEQIVCTRSVFDSLRVISDEETFAISASATRAQLVRLDGEWRNAERILLLWQ